MHLKIHFTEEDLEFPVCVYLSFFFFYKGVRYCSAIVSSKFDSSILKTDSMLSAT